MPRNVSKTFLLLLTVFCIVLLIALCIKILSARIPPEELTRSHMIETAIRIREYLRTHQRLPEDMSQLPEREGYSDGRKDGWGNEIKYTADSCNVVTLTSFGRDGELGGQGRNADIVESFNAGVENDYPFIHSLAGPNATSQ
ncbi:MAG: type II secretion system protein GspG [Planctomycetota bacterium]|jgi:hypothetical protein